MNKVSASYLPELSPPGSGRGIEASGLIGGSWESGLLGSVPSSATDLLM